MDLLSNLSLNCYDRGLIFPLINEDQWSDSSRAFLYLIGLFYLTFGVVIVSEALMCALGRIIAAKRKVPLTDVEIQQRSSDDPDRQSEILPYKEIPLWNPIIVELVLIPLGLNCVQLLAPIIELLANNFTAGLLGPGLVIGSAAFNLM